MTPHSEFSVITFAFFLLILPILLQYSILLKYNLHYIIPVSYTHLYMTYPSIGWFPIMGKLMYSEPSKKNSRTEFTVTKYILQKIGIQTFWITEHYRNRIHTVTVEVTGWWLTPSNNLTRNIRLCSHKLTITVTVWRILNPL